MGNIYAYESSKPHAVTGVQRFTGADLFGYDASGNMLSRLEAGVQWTQTFNAENRLASVSNGTDTWTFVYDGDGNRVKQVNPDGSITLFLGGGLYTVEDAAGVPQVTKYYSIAGQRVAMTDGSGVKYLLTDHLGSITAVVVMDTYGALKANVPVYVFDGEVDTGISGLTDVNGRVEFTLPNGNYRFKADMNGTPFWSGGSNHCAVPGCHYAEIIVTFPVTVRVVDETGAPLSGATVTAFDGEVSTGITGISDENGKAQLNLPQGAYRFLADYGGSQGWSGTENHCILPGCLRAEVVVDLPDITPMAPVGESLTETPTLEVTATETATPEASATETETPTETPTPEATETPTERG